MLTINIYSIFACTVAFIQSLFKFQQNKKELLQQESWIFWSSVFWKYSFSKLKKKSILSSKISTAADHWKLLFCGCLAFPFFFLSKRKISVLVTSGILSRLRRFYSQRTINLIFSFPFFYYIIIVCVCVYIYITINWSTKH